MKYNKLSIVGVYSLLATLTFALFVTTTDFSCKVLGTYEQTVNSWCSITHQYLALFFTVILPIISFISGAVSIVQLRNEKEKGCLFALLSIVAPLLIFMITLIVVSSATS